MSQFVRHGDVLLRPISEIPKGATKKVDAVEYTVAYGEVTGHSHRLQVIDPKTASVRVFTDEKGQAYLDLSGSATLTHQEHKQVTVEKGVYLVVIEREYDYAKEQMAKVVD